MTVSHENDDSGTAVLLCAVVGRWDRCVVVRYTGRVCEALQKGTDSCAREHTLQAADRHCRLQADTAGCRHTLQATDTYCRLQKHTAGCRNALQAADTHSRLQTHTAGCKNILQAADTHCRL